MNKPTRLIGIKEVSNKTSLSASTIYKSIREGIFPEPIPITKRRSAWLESEIDEWIQEQINKRERMTDIERKGTQCF